MRSRLLGAAVAGVGLVLTAAGTGGGLPARGGGLARTTLAGATRLSRGAIASANWAGYAAYPASYDNAPVFSSVSGTWTQPAVTCSGGRQYSAFWVGIDGDAIDVPSSDTVEQIGTEADCAGRNDPVYYAWWALTPASPAGSFPAGNLDPSSYPVAPGDTISATVSESSSSSAQDFTLTIKDAPTSGPGSGWTFDTTLSTSGVEQATAEWVAEAPSLCNAQGCRVLPLANFGTVDFTGASVTTLAASGPIDDRAWQNSSITMYDRNATATPSTLADTSGSGGTSAFSVSWSSASPGGPPQGGGHPGGGHGGPPGGGAPPPSPGPPPGGGAPPPGGPGGGSPGGGGHGPGPGGHRGL